MFERPDCPEQLLDVVRAAGSHELQTALASRRSGEFKPSCPLTAEVVTTST